MSKPKVLWICDVRGWAFDNRAQQLSKAMPDYEHKIIYIGQKHLRGLQAAAADADIVFCSFVRWIRFFKSTDNIVSCLTSNAQFFDNKQEKKDDNRTVG